MSTKKNISCKEAQKFEIIFFKKRKMLIFHNLILLIFKFHIYKSRVSGSLIFKAFFHKLVRIKNPEMGTVLRNQRKLVTS